MNKESAIALISAHADEFRNQYLVRSLALFGSVSRDEAHAGSDIDILADFATPPDFDRFMGLKCRLEDLLGIRVDLVTRNGLKPRIRATVEREAIRVA